MIPSNDPILAAWGKVLSDKKNNVAILARSGEKIFSFHDLEEFAFKYQQDFKGLPPNSIVALKIGNHPHWPALFLAIIQSGLICLPLDKSLQEVQQEQILETCGAQVLIERNDSSIIYKYYNQNPIALGDPHPSFLKLTSGVTGQPKLIKFRSHQLYADALNIYQTMGFSKLDINFGLIPFSHSYGFSNLIMQLLCFGLPLAVSEDPFPRAIVKDLLATGATVFPGTPLFFQSLIELEPLTFPQLRLCISAGALLEPRIISEFYKKYGLKIHVFYGSSECGGICYDRSDEVNLSRGFVGMPLENVEIHLMGNSEVGNIFQIKSSSVGDAYYPEDTANERLKNHIFQPNDLLKEESSGFCLAGRNDDIFNVAGKKVSAQTIEEVLLKHPAVKQAIVFGIPSPQRQDEIIACITTKYKLNNEILLAHCEAKLSQWQVPRAIWMVENIPINERGKVERKSLKEKYLKEVKLWIESIEK